MSTARVTVATSTIAPGGDAMVDLATVSADGEQFVDVPMSTQVV